MQAPRRNKLLLEAARRGDLHEVRAVVETGVDVNAADRGGCTALAQAAAEGHLDVVRYLAGESEADVNATTNWGITILAGAAANGHMDVVRYLAGECAVDVNIANNWGLTALMEAAANGHVDVVRYLVGDHGAAVDTATEWGTTALLVAAQNGQLDVVRYLVEECRADVDTTDADGETALAKAARRDHRDIVRCLAGELESGSVMECGAVGDKKDGEHATELEKCGDRQVDSLAEETAGAMEVDADRSTAVVKTSGEGNIDDIQFWESSKATNSAGTSSLAMFRQVPGQRKLEAAYEYAAARRYLRKEWGLGTNPGERLETALLNAAGHGIVDAVGYLVKECGADVNATDREGATALMKAVEGGCGDTVRYLVGECEANTTITDNAGSNALMKAAEAGYVDTVRYLVGNCRAEANSNEFSKALMRAAAGGHISVIRYLVGECGADANATDEEGKTLLMNASVGGHIDSVRHLVEVCEVNIEAVDRHGISALMTAAGWGHIEVVQYLVEQLWIRKSSTYGLKAAVKKVVDRARAGMARWLVGDRGCVADGTDDTGATALIIAAAGGHIDVVRYLARECRANVQATTEEGATALMKAAGQGHFDVVQYLVGDCRADVNAIGKFGSTAFKEAAEGGHFDIAWYLAGECKAKINPTGYEWPRVLMNAAAQGHADFVRYLVNKIGVGIKEEGARVIASAAGGGHVDIVRYLVETCGAGVSVQDNYSNAAIMKAADGGHVDVVRYLVAECGADVNTVDRDRAASVLMKAAGSGHAAVVQYLVGECGADVNATDIRGDTVLMKAAGGGNIDIVKYLVGEGNADVNTTNNSKDTAVIIAARGGYLDILRYLVEECNADVHITNDSRNTAIIEAAGGGQVEVVRYLAEQCGIDVDSTYYYGNTVLMKAAEEGHMNVIRYLLEECNADMNATNAFGDDALVRAALSGETGIVRYLLEDCGMAKNTRGEVSTELLIKAAGRGHVDIIYYLSKECGADVNVRDRDGVTLLMKAATAGHLALGRCLATDCGADVDTTDKQGTTALMQVAAKGDTDLIRFLITECGANVNTAGENGTTVLMQAAAKGDIDVVRCLVEQHGADVNATDKNGVTALMKSTILRHTDVVRYLGECGANVNAINKDGYSALRIAGEQNDQELQRVLTQYLVVAPSMGAINAVSPDNSITDKPSWFISPSEIELLNFVKTGNVGGEYRAKWLDADVAVKLFLPRTSDHALFEDEVHLWHQLRHPNVIKMYGACDMSSLPLPFFVCEYASNGSLHEYARASLTTQPKVWSYLHEAALGLEYLHERGIVHGDLRSSNILIGSDGLSKLTNFGRRDLTRMLGLNVESLRWQAPEVLEGNTLSFASDVYSLGMCILEATTREVPWKNWRIDDIRDVKNRWDPAANGTESWEPLRPPTRAAYTLVWRMCSQEPSKRASIAFCVHELEKLASEENRYQPDHEPLSGFDYYCNYGKHQDLWMEVQIRMEGCNCDIYRQAFEEIENLRVRLETCTPPPRVSERFYSLLRDFYYTISVPSEQARVLQLSATRATATSITSFCRHLRSLWAALGETAEVARAREKRWADQRSKHIEIFVSEASKSYILLEELNSPEERLVFLTSLKSEIEQPSFPYTPTQLDMLKKAYEDITGKLEVNGLSQMTPEWFIPWDELTVDTSRDPLGRGGFGSVYRAKWLDSDVVVKHLVACHHGNNLSSSVYDSLLQPSLSPVSITERAESMTTFLREVNIWFGFSHPHVIRLFGACHVGRPFFVCEYATNGTLVSYLRNHPNELWSKLHEAALGVQYLHARGVVHGDLKGNNIVIGSDKKAKVTDFGLSLNTSDGSDARISGATHWVAPECFNCEDARPTFASDIYSLGMCVVEALPVVEAGEDKMKACLPWRRVDNIVVKHEVKLGKLPPRPQACNDRHWRLIEKMCIFAPEKRLKISTVVDELARLVNTSDDDLTMVTLNKTPLRLRAAPKVISAAFELLERLSNVEQAVTLQHRELHCLYGSLWGDIRQVYEHVNRRLGSRGVVEFCSLVSDADEATKKLASMANSLLSLTETALRCYSLQRRLKKFMETHFISHTCPSNLAEYRSPRVADSNVRKRTNL